MKLDFAIFMWCTFVIIYSLRVLIVYLLLIKKLRFNKNISGEKLIFFIYTIPIHNAYDIKVKRTIKFVNVLSKLIIIVMVLNFILIFLESLIHDMR